MSLPSLIVFLLVSWDTRVLVGVLFEDMCQRQPGVGSSRGTQTWSGQRCGGTEQWRVNTIKVNANAIGAMVVQCCFVKKKKKKKSDSINNKITTNSEDTHTHTHTHTKATTTTKTLLLLQKNYLS